MASITSLVGGPGMVSPEHLTPGHSIIAYIAHAVSGTGGVTQHVLTNSLGPPSSHKVTQVVLGLDMTGDIDTALMQIAPLVMTT